MDRGADKRVISSIYQSSNTGLPSSIKHALDTTLRQGLEGAGTVNFFFRADDIGVPSKNYSRMMTLFLKYKIPLCLAVVPTWLTWKRWKVMDDFIEKGPDLFCWHMHGYRHMNYEAQGKKQEFGPVRSLEAIFNDLSRGHKTLSTLLKERFTPVFTPPWNRCSPVTLQTLKKIGFKGVSRSYGCLPFPPAGLKDFPVHVDLHTRKEKIYEQGWKMLFKEILIGMKQPACGIMIHHMRMNDPAFIFLECLLEQVSIHKQIQVITFKDLL